MKKSVDERLIRAAGKSTNALMRLLFEGLDWPRPANLEPEDVPLIKWSPQDLHLDPESVASLTRIQQLPSLKDGQPFGVFILNFEGGRLPVGAVRRVVSTLVRKKRAQHKGKGGLWNLDDLIFFCQSKDGVSALHMVAFQDSGKVPVLKVVSWNENSTDNAIKLLAQEQLPDLMWPSSADADQWRARWRGAFTTTYRQTIKTAKALAEKMAEVAATVRDEVKDLYAVETGSGPLRQLHDEVKRSLRADMTAEEFADMYAQTMVYGLLTSRITHPEDFHADALNTMLKFENPFLDALYEQFRSTGDEAFDPDEFGLHDLADLLAAVDVEKLLADFGVDERKDDPVVFFYEEFLQQYDPSQRKELGAYYTPIPVVRFMVRAVDEIIKTEFGLPLGVADSTTWGEYSKAKGLPIPAGLKKTDPVIRMIDPATGTGTFLLEWYRQAKQNLGKHATTEQLADVVSRMDALEISLSSYSVAQLKTSLELPPAVRERQRMGIRLSDTLAPRSTLGQGSLFDDDPIAAEGRAAEVVKFDTRHSVVIGNPPYMRVDRATSGGWIAHPPDGGRSLFDDIHEPARKHTIFSHQASLFNLYVYFWRWAIWKTAERYDNSPSVCCFITASSWLNGPGFMGLRELSRNRSDRVLVVDLGGNNTGARIDENVFPIQTPVSIVLLIKKSWTTSADDGAVLYRKVEGNRHEKLESLSNLSLKRAEWTQVRGGSRDPFTPGFGSRSWRTFPAVVDVFPWQQPGCKYGRTWPISPASQLLEARWRRFVSTIDLNDRAACFVTGSSGRTISTQVGGLTRLADLPRSTPAPPVARYGYRSFDRQWSFRDPRLAALERPALWKSLSPVQLFLVTKPTHTLGFGPAAVASESVPDLDHFRGSYGGKDVIPLYRDAAGTPNADPELLAVLMSAHRSVSADAKPVTVERLFAYCYGVLAGADYTDRFREELETPGPRIPISRDPKLFESMVAHGERLLWLQTFGERFRTSKRADLEIGAGIRWLRRPTRIPEDTKDFRFDAEGERLHVADGVLLGVSEDVWAFEVSGLDVVKKWLGYRTRKGTGRAAASDSPLDQIRPSEWEPEWSEELRELVHVLAETIALLPHGIALLDSIVEGPLVAADELPVPPEALRKPPKAGDGSADDPLDLD